MKIDETDRKIISLLQDDARQSNAAIARIIGVSEATIRRTTTGLVWTVPERESEEMKSSGRKLSATSRCTANGNRLL